MPRKQTHHLFLLLLSFIILYPHHVFADNAKNEEKFYEIPILSLNYYLLPNGSVEVVKEIEYRFNGNFSRIYLTFDENKKDINVLKVEEILPSGESMPYKAIDPTMADGRPPGTWTFTRSNNRLEVFFRASNETRKFRLTYQWDKAMVLYSDDYVGWKWAIPDFQKMANYPPKTTVKFNFPGDAQDVLFASNLINLKPLSDGNTSLHFDFTEEEVSYLFDSKLNVFLLMPDTWFDLTQQNALKENKPGLNAWKGQTKIWEAKYYWFSRDGKIYILMGIFAAILGVLLLFQSGYFGLITIKVLWFLTAGWITKKHRMILLRRVTPTTKAPEDLSPMEAVILWPTKATFIQKYYLDPMYIRVFFASVLYLIQKGYLTWVDEPEKIGFVKKIYPEPNQTLSPDLNLIWTALKTFPEEFALSKLSELAPIYFQHEMYKVALKNLEEKGYLNVFPIKQIENLTDFAGKIGLILLAFTGVSVILILSSFLLSKLLELMNLYDYIFLFISLEGIGFLMLLAGIVGLLIEIAFLILTMLLSIVLLIRFYTPLGKKRALEWWAFYQGISKRKEPLLDPSGALIYGWAFGIGKKVTQWIETINKKHIDEQWTIVKHQLEKDFLLLSLIPLTLQIFDNIFLPSLLETKSNRENEQSTDRESSDRGGSSGGGGFGSGAD